MSKRKRVELSLQDKVKMIKSSETLPKPTIKVLGEMYGVGKSTVGDILKRKEHYQTLWENNLNPNKRRCVNGAKFENLNELVWQWFGQARAKNIPLSGPLIKEKALTFAEQLGISDFKASTGWLDKWKARYTVKQFIVSGESAGVDQCDVDSYRQRIPEIVGSFSPKDVFNCDETGLYFRALPDKTLSVAGESTKGALADLVRALSTNINTDDLDDIDANEPTEDTSSNWEKNLVDSYKQPEVNSEDQSSDCDECETETELDRHRPGSDMSHKDVLHCLEKLTNFALEKDFDYFSAVQNLKSMTERKIVDRQCRQKQTSIKSFFK